MRAVQKTSGIPRPLFIVQKNAEQILKDQKMIKWIWEHTKSPEHAWAIEEALRLLARGFVDWED